MRDSEKLKIATIALRKISSQILGHDPIRPRLLMIVRDQRKLARKALKEIDPDLKLWIVSKKKS